MITILYATQTGNAEHCAEWLEDSLNRRGLASRRINLADYDAARLTEESVALFVVSTYGEGDPPEAAAPFAKTLRKLCPGTLGHLRYSVFALGDIDYTLFCGFGYDCDQYLHEAGARRMLEVEECNLDQAKRLPGWTDRVAARLTPLSSSNPQLLPNHP